MHDLFFPSFFLSFRCHRPINDAFKVSEGTEEGGRGRFTYETRSNAKRCLRHRRHRQFSPVHDIRPVIVEAENPSERPNDPSVEINK